ncbi:MAG TPA: hypothetical protein VI386_17760 [Candidatus Sulfotelmatobacter sp.]
MEITIKIPDQVWREDQTYVKYFETLQQMVNRMAVSHFKYGPIDTNAEMCGVDEMLSGRKRLWMYDGIGPEVDGKKGNTGNAENLLDAANFFIIDLPD